MQPNSDDRWKFMRDVVVFQLKMFLDNVRDLVLMPVSLVAALIDLVLRGEREGARFYRVLRWGRHSETVIDVYSAIEDQPPPRKIATRPRNVSAIRFLFIVQRKRMRVAERMGHCATRHCPARGFGLLIGVKTRSLCAILAVSAGLLGSCTNTSTSTTTTTQSQTDQTRKRVHTQEELKKSGQSEVGPALEKTDPAVTISR